MRALSISLSNFFDSNHFCHIGSHFSPTAIICNEIKDINDEMYSEYVIYRNITKWNRKSSSSNTMECPSLTQDMRDSLGILILIYSFFFTCGDSHKNKETETLM
jgi:hypothetical protein